MGSYRFEIASTGRAGCQNKECKDAKVKIQKGELRMGTWVDSERIQAFMWRHWGCVTPKLISNINSSLEEDAGEGDEKDYTAIDGYDEIPEEEQDRVRGALEQGHVADDDWNGDVEMNRPGKTGFRIRKKKADAAEDDDAEKKEPAKTTKRGRAESKTTAQDEPEAEKPKAKRTKKDAAKKPAAKKPVAKEESESEEKEEEEEEEPKKPARKGRSTAATTASTEKASKSTKADSKPAATRSKRKSAASAAADEDDAEEQVEKPAEKTPKRGGRKKAT